MNDTDSLPTRADIRRGLERIARRVDRQPDTPLARVVPEALWRAGFVAPRIPQLAIECGFDALAPDWRAARGERAAAIVRRAREIVEGLERQGWIA